MHKLFINKQFDKALAIALLLTGLVTAYVFIKHIYLEQLVNLNHEIGMKKRKNAKIDYILASEKVLKGKINQQKTEITKNRIFLNSSKSATAASELQNYLKKLITTHSNARILTIKPFPVRKQDNYSETSLEISIKDIGHKELHRVLYMIESMAPVLLIKELDIKRVQLRFNAILKPEAGQEKLGVVIVVSGFYRELSGQTQPS